MGIEAEVMKMVGEGERGDHETWREGVEGGGVMNGAASTEVDHDTRALGEKFTGEK